MAAPNYRTLCWMRKLVSERSGDGGWGDGVARSDEVPRESQKGLSQDVGGGGVVCVDSSEGW